MLTKSIVYSTFTLFILSACVDGKQTTKAPSQTTAASAPTAPSSNPSKPVVKVATEANFLPFRYRDGQHSQPLGFQIDVLKEVGDAVNMQFEYVLTPKAPKLNLLNQQNDYVATLATFDNTDENKELADFTLPITTTKYVVHLKSDTHSTGSLNDLRGKTISIDHYYASNPKNLELLEKLTGSPNNIVKEEFLYPAWKNMVTGKTDGVFGEDLVLDYTFHTHKEQTNFKIKTVDLNLPPNERSLLLKKSNPELLNKINEGINTIKATGKYQHLEHKWFPDIK